MNPPRALVANVNFLDWLIMRCPCTCALTSRGQGGCIAHDVLADSPGPAGRPWDRSSLKNGRPRKLC